MVSLFVEKVISSTCVACISLVITNPNSAINLGVNPVDKHGPHTTPHCCHTPHTCCHTPHTCSATHHTPASTHHTPALPHTTLLLPHPTHLLLGCGIKLQAGDHLHKHGLTYRTALACRPRLHATSGWHSVYRSSGSSNEWHCRRSISIRSNTLPSTKRLATCLADGAHAFVAGGWVDVRPAGAQGPVQHGSHPA